MSEELDPPADGVAGTRRRPRIREVSIAERITRVARVAAVLLDVPIVVAAPVGNRLQWRPVGLGLLEDELRLVHSLAAHAPPDGEPLVVGDALADGRLRGEPLVIGRQGIRFVACVRIVAGDGSALATLCLLDTRPRELEAGELERLRDVVAWAEVELGVAGMSRALDARRKEETYLRTILDTVPQGLVTLDSAGTVELVNRSAAEMLTRTPEELEGRNAEEVLDEVLAGPRRRPGEASPFHRALRLGLPTTDTVELKRSGDRLGFTVEYHTVPLLSDQAVEGAVLTFSDVTERTALEEFKDQFVSSVSHELRTPLTSIRGYAETLAAGEVGELSDEQREYVEVVHRNARRLEELVNDLLVLSRLEAGHLEIAEQAVALGPLLERLVSDLEPAARSAGMTLDLTPPPGVVVEADPGRLLQAFANLVANALKFSVDGGTVRIDLEATDEEAVVSVSDSGVGIPADEIQHLTDRFFRASTARQFEGTGLGLAITNHIVVQHGGWLEVESEVGVGSTFRVWLPRRRPDGGHADRSV